MDIVLVKIQSGIQFSLFHEQFFQARFLLEGFCQFPSKGGQVGFESVKAFLLPFGNSFQGSEGVFDALDGAHRIRGVQGG